MDRIEKEALVASLHETFSAATLVVVTCPLGMNVAQSQQLRMQLRDAGASYKVTKNRLTRLALKDTQFEALCDLFSGPTAIAWSDDAVAAARVAVSFSEENSQLKILGGGLGSEVLDQSGVAALARLPSLDELRGKLVGLIQTPATRLAGVLQAPGGQLARVLSAHAEQEAA